jgi:hypothetical protein
MKKTTVKLILIWGMVGGMIAATSTASAWWSRIWIGDVLRPHYSEYGRYFAAAVEIPVYSTSEMDPYDATEINLETYNFRDDSHVSVQLCAANWKGWSVKCSSEMHSRGKGHKTFNLTGFKETWSKAANFRYIRVFGEHDAANASVDVAGLNGLFIAY